MNKRRIEDILAIVLGCIFSYIGGRYDSLGSFVFGAFLIVAGVNLYFTVDSK
jgi:hypothetical protein